VRAVVQRVSSARVVVDGEAVGEIGAGLCVLLGVAREDGEVEATRLAGRIARLRIFENEEGRFDRSLLDIGGAALVVSQFTLIANTAKGNRPSFTNAAQPEQAEPHYEAFCVALRELGVGVATGRFGARMRVEIANDGPVTIVLDL
jgi:D-aminoacyl-tRNA deacylase